MSKKWNVLVYQASDNNLSEEMIWALKDIIEAPKEDFRAIVQFDPLGTKPRRYDSEKKPQVAVASLPPSITGTRVNTDLIPDKDIEAAFDKTTWCKEMKGSLTGISKSIEMHIPLGDPPPPESFAAQAAAVKTQIEKALGLTPDYYAIKSALSELSGNFQEDEPVGSSEESSSTGSPSPALTQVQKQLCLSWVERASAALEFTETFDDFKEFLEENSAAPEMIEQFIDEYLAKDDDQRNMVVLSGHGSGAVGDFLTDDGSLTALSITSLAKLLEGKKIDILAMESCLMSMAEVCYEVRVHNQCVKFVVGSEGLMLNSGWPYKHILKILQDAPSISAEELTKEIVKVYISYYRDYEVAGLSTDHSAIRLECMETLKDEFKKLVDELKKGLNEKSETEELDVTRHRVLVSLLLAHWEAQSYNDEQYVDLWDFCDRLSVHYPELTNECEDVKKAVKNVVMISGYTGAAFQHSHGLSIYFPWAEDDYATEYEKLQFAVDTEWAGFLKEFLKKTRRMRRDQAAQKDNDLLRFDVADFGVDLPVVGAYRKPKAGTKRKPKAGTKRYLMGYLKGDMKNPPAGFYQMDCEAAGGDCKKVDKR